MEEPRSVDLREIEEAGPDPNTAGHRRRSFLGAIVRAATAREAGEATTTPLRCPGRGRRRSCTGRLRVGRHDVPAEIRWECVRCGHAGRITGWRGTLWDLSRIRGPDPGEEPDLELLLPQADYDFVKDKVLDLESARIVAGAEWRAEGVVLRGTWDELEEMAGLVAFEANRAKSDRVIRRFEAVLDRIDRALESRGAGAGPPAGDQDDTAGPDRSPFPRVLIDSLRDVLIAMPDASEAELQAALGRAVDAYQNRPQADLCGLSPAEVHRLLTADWGAPGGAFETNDGLALEDLDGSPLLINARILLTALRDEEGTRATRAGNLNRAFVGRMLETMRFPEDFVDQVRRMNKVVNEEDVWPLHTLRVVLVRAGLVKIRKGVFSVTRRGADLLAEAAAGALYARLFVTFFRRFNLAYLDRYPEADDFQKTIAVPLYLFGRIGSEWLSPARATAAMALPVVRQRVPPHADGYEPLPGLVEHRFLRPLVEFGLAETRIAGRGEEADGFPSWTPPDFRRLYRKEPLFDRFLTFRLQDLSA